MEIGNGDRGARRAHERRNAKQVRKGQATYRTEQQRRRAVKRTATSMSRVAAGEIGTEAMRRNVLRTLERTKAGL